jgi:hypothetical protein
MLRAYISIHSTNYFDELRENNVAHKTKMRIYNFNADFLFEIPAHFLISLAHQVIRNTGRGRVKIQAFLLASNSITAFGSHQVQTVL